MSVELKPDYYELVELMVEHGRISVKELESLLENTKGLKKSIIYRYLKHMENIGMCYKEDFHYYVLDISWLAENVMRAESWFERQLQQLDIKELLPEGMNNKTWRFNNLKYAYFFLQQIIMSVLYHDKTRQMYVWTQHPWYFFCSLKAETTFNKLLNKWAGITRRFIGGDTWLDRKYLDKWEMSESYSFFGEKSFSEHKDKLITIVGDFIITLKMEKKILKKIEEIFDQAQKSGEIDYQVVNSLFNIKEQITVELDRNPTKANGMIRIFKEKDKEN